MFEGKDIRDHLEGLKDLDPQAVPQVVPFFVLRLCLKRHIEKNGNTFTIR